MSGFQAVECVLHGLKQPQTLQRKVLQMFQKKSRPARRYQDIPEVRGQEAQCD